MLGWIYPVEWHLTGSWGLLRPLQSYKSSGHTLMLLMLWTDNTCRSFTSFISLRKKETTTRHPTITSPSLESLPVLSSTYCSQVHCSFVDVMYSCSPPRPSFCPRKPHESCEVKRKKRSSGQSGRGTVDRHYEDVVWRDARALCTHCSEPFLAPSRTRVGRKMSRQEGQSGDSATKQSLYVR